MNLPVLKKGGDPATRPAKEINKIVLRTQNIKTVYFSRLQQHQSTHTFDQISNI